MHTALKIDFAARPPITDQSVIEFWIQRWLSSNPDAVAGLLTLFFLNLVKLSPGQGMYQPDGLLHAYLEGQNIELMANSDNVLRAGLTPKHIDVPELLDVCSIQPTQPSDYLISPQADGRGITVFPTPFHEFELSRVDIQSHLPCAWPACNAEILLIMDGTATVACGDQSYELRCGEAIAILPEAGAVTVSTSSQSHIYRARNL
jgi:mannose-6-phosphate isomerase